MKHILNNQQEIYFIKKSIHALKYWSLTHSGEYNSIHLPPPKIAHC